MMSEEEYLSEKLQRFSLLDIVLVKMVYFLIGLLVATSYLVLTKISWIFYLTMFLIATMPLIVHLFSFEGSYIEKVKQYLKTNQPAYQVLLFFSMFFKGCMIASLVSFFATVPWFVYLILIVALAIKPVKSNLFW